MKLTISRFGYTSKPEPITIKWMQSPELQAKTQPAFELLDCSIEQFADKLRSGHSWRACNAKSGKKEDVYEAYSVAIDIDDATQPPEDYISRCEMMGFVPNIMYYSFSHGAPQYAGTYRFRLVWCFEQPITPAHWHTIATVLIKYFDADAACKNENRLWHGTNKQVEIIKNEYTNPDVFGGLILNAKLDSGSRVKDARKSKKDGCKDWVDNYCAATDVVKVETNGAWEKDLMRVCPLWKMWCNGEYLNYDERLMLWQNMKFLRPANGSTSIIDIVWKYYNDETYKTHTLTREQIAEKMRDTSLNPYRICCGNSLSVGEWLMQRNKPFENKLEKCTLEELDKEMAQFPALLENDKTMYISCQTGAGKSAWFRKWVASTPKKKIIYAAPTYALLEEQRQYLFDEYGLEMIVPPKGTYTETDELLMQMGSSRVSGVDWQRADVIRRIKSRNETGIFGITHHLLTRLTGLNNCGIDTIVVDENIEFMITDEVEVSKENLQYVRNYCTDGDFAEITKCFEQRLHHPTDIAPIQKMLKSFDVKEYIKTEKPIDKLCLLANGEWQARVSGVDTIRAYRASHLFDYGIPVKLMTATPMHTLLEQKMKSINKEVITMRRAKNTGEIIQYLGQTGAKGKDCEKVDELIEYIKSSLPEEEWKDAYVISFKASADKWKDAGFKLIEIIDEEGRSIPVHLGNNCGLNMVSGKHIIVAGKMDMDETYYNNLFWDYIAIDFDQPEPERRLHVVECNGVLQKIFCWDDERLRAIQMERINYYLEQAAGRARALRQAGAKVYVFSNFPIADADKYIPV